MYYNRALLFNASEIKQLEELWKLSCDALRSHCFVRFPKPRKEGVFAIITKNGLDKKQIY